NATLDCRSGAATPDIAWRRGAYERFRVEVSWLPDFSSKVTSGSTLLRASSWSPGRNKWKRVCARAGSLVYLRVLGVDKDRRRTDPGRKAYTAALALVAQH